MFEESEFRTLQMWGTQFAGMQISKKCLSIVSGEFVGATISGNANFDQAILGSVTFEGALFAEMRTSNRRISGMLYLEDCLWWSHLRWCGLLERQHDQGDLTLDGATFSATGSLVDLSEIEVADTTSLDDITAASGLDLNYGVVQGLKISRETKAYPLSGSDTRDITGQLISSHADQYLKVNGLNNGGTTTLDHLYDQRFA